MNVFESGDGAAPIIASLLFPALEAEHTFTPDGFSTLGVDCARESLLQNTVTHHTVVGSPGFYDVTRTGASCASATGAVSEAVHLDTGAPDTGQAVTLLPTPSIMLSPQEDGLAE